ncbi:MAG: LysR family transcriptional regulator [Polyangiaceae bacterium]
MDASLLATLRKVAETGKISAAARLLHLSQPAVTAQVRKLESQCGQPLVTRSVKGVTLTQAGLRLLPYAEKIDGLLADAQRDVSVAPMHGSVLRMGASTTSAAHIVPKLVAAFLKSSGPLAVVVHEGNTSEVLRLLEERTVPIGIVEGHTRAPRVKLEPFIDDELVPVVSSNAPAALRNVRRAKDLHDLPLIWREDGSGTRAVVDRALTKAIGRRRNVARDVHPGGTAAVRACVLEGLGVAFLTRLGIEDDLAADRLRVLPLRDLRIPRHFSWAFASAEVTGVARDFLRFARFIHPARASFRSSSRETRST